MLRFAKNARNNENDNQQQPCIRFSSETNLYDTNNFDVMLNVQTPVFTLTYAIMNSLSESKKDGSQEIDNRQVQDEDTIYNVCYFAIERALLA